MATQKTCSNCKHWKTEQSIFDFQTTNGICLKAPENNSVGYHHPSFKTVFDDGDNKGKPCFNCFSETPTERYLYFITKRNF